MVVSMRYQDVETVIKTQMNPLIRTSKFPYKQAFRHLSITELIYPKITDRTTV